MVTDSPLLMVFVLDSDRFVTLVSFENDSVIVACSVSVSSAEGLRVDFNENEMDAMLLALRDTVSDVDGVRLTETSAVVDIVLVTVSFTVDVADRVANAEILTVSENERVIVLDSDMDNDLERLGDVVSVMVCENVLKSDTLRVLFRDCDTVASPDLVLVILSSSVNGSVAVVVFDTTLVSDAVLRAENEGDVENVVDRSSDNVALAV